MAIYKNEELNPQILWSGAEEELFLLPLLTAVETEKRFANVGAVKIIREIKNLGGPYHKNLPQIKELLKKLDAKLELPKSVVHYETLNLFLDEWCKDKTFPIEESYSGGNPLFFLYSIKKNYRRYTFPVLLSYYKFNGDKTEFGSVPILTFMMKSKPYEYFRIFPPFVYMDSRKTRPDIYTKLIHSNTAKMAESWNVVEEQDTYAACGLFYRGKIAFHVAKKGYRASDLEFLRKNLLNLRFEKENIKNSWNSHKQENARIAAWKTTGKIEYYKKCIAEEEAKINAEKIRKREKDFDAKWKNVKDTAASIKFKVTESDIENHSASVNAVKRLLKDYTELRWKEDIGNGIFFRKEKFYNGDYNWRLLLFLASGEKIGTKENTNVLHLLYRYRQDGDRSETLFFPFVSIVKEGKDSKFSFLWRVFQLKKEKGKIGGYFMFIPF